MADRKSQFQRKKVAIIYGSLQDIHIGAPGHVILDTIRSLPTSEKFDWTVFYYRHESRTESINATPVIGVCPTWWDTLLTKIIRLLPQRERKHYFVTSNLEFIRYLFSVVRVLFFFRPHVVVVHVSYPLPRMIRTILPSAKILYYHHGSTMHSKLNLKQWKSLEKSCDGIIAVSQAAFDGVEASFGPMKCPHWVLYNASPITQQQLSEYASPRESIRRQYGFQNKIVFVFCGRMVASKGVFPLISAFKKLQMEFSEVALILVGDASVEQDARDGTGAIQMVRDAVEVSNGRIVLTGWVSKELVAGYIASADIAVLPSLAPEGISLFAIDSIALGKPLIVTDAGGNTEVVMHGQTGILISAEPSKVENELLLAMKKLVKEPLFYQQCSSSSIELSKTKFNIKTMNNSYMEIMENLVN